MNFPEHPSLTCPNCSQTIDAGHPFCTNCGQPNLYPLPSRTGNPAENTPFATPQPFSWGVFQIALGTFLVLAGVAMSGSIVFALQSINHAAGLLIGSLVVGLVIVSAVWFFALRPQRLSFGRVGLVAPTTAPVHTAALTAGVLLLSLGFTGVYGLAAQASGFKFLVPPEITTDILLPGPAAALSFLALAVWTPFVEEMFFRGFVYRGLASRFGPLQAILLSAVLFSLFHVLPGVLLPIFVTGILFAFLYHRTGSLWPCIAAHAGQNGLVVLYTLIQQ